MRSEKYNFVFDKTTGFSVRWGRTKEEDPFWGPLPELADISISNRCDNGCDFCYRNSTPDGTLMALDDFEAILQQLPTTFQVALGGGEPTQHPDFIDFLKVCRKYDVVPNYTTNGNNLSPEIIKATKDYCGAVAVSWYPNALSAIRKFVEAGIKTNIHFVVTKGSIPEALQFVRDPDFFKKEGVNAIIFLLHKAVGRGRVEDTPTFDDVSELVTESFRSRAPIGFDACFMKHIAQADSAEMIDANWMVLDHCDSARFTMYSDEHLNAQPCSFCMGEKFSENIREMPIADIWSESKFEKFRNILRDDQRACPATHPK